MLAFNVLPFALVILLYPSLESMLANSVIRLGLLIWACLIVLHLAIVALVDFRESIQFFQRERARHQMITAQKNRQRMMKQLYVAPAEEDHS